MVETIVVGFMLFVLVGWPMLTYAGDAVRYVWYRIKEVTSK